MKRGKKPKKNPLDYTNQIIGEKVNQFVSENAPEIYNIASFLLFERNLHATGKVEMPSEVPIRDFLNNYIYNSFIPHFDRGNFLSNPEYFNNIGEEGFDGEDDVIFGVPEPEMEFSVQLITEAKIILGLMPKNPFNKSSEIFFPKEKFLEIASKYKVKTKSNSSDELADMIMSDKELFQRFYTYIGAFEYIFGEPKEQDKEWSLKMVVSNKDNIYDSQRKHIQHFINTICRKHLNFSANIHTSKLVEKPKDRRYDFFDLGNKYVETNPLLFNKGHSTFDLVFGVKPTQKSITDLCWTLLDGLSKYMMVVLEEIEVDIQSIDETDMDYSISYMGENDDEED